MGGPPSRLEPATSRNRKFVHFFMAIGVDVRGIGPGLKGLFQKDRLPFSKRRVSEAAIADQLKKPFDRMPRFRI
jgi:hypothetical protein